MKYRIAICDDEVATCEELEKLTLDVFGSFSCRAEVEIFYSGESFINHIKNNNIVYDFILLDIELYELNGVSVGKYIREIISDVRAQIIFISSKTIYAMELFQVTPLDFLVKPITYDILSTTIKRGINILNTLQDSFECIQGNTIIRIPTSQILYFESSGRKVKVVTAENDVWFYDQISKISKSLSNSFIQVHKSYIVNINAVRECHADHIVLLDGNQIPISRTYRESVRKYMMGRLR